mmetsp:Transcript_45722/g.82720  ORF Transcript_45722/g.82720 Transcript_45722/m.82720 type:complete len:511 (-) Transcript_45722:78-1610(-)
MCILQQPHSEKCLSSSVDSSRPEQQCQRSVLRRVCQRLLAIPLQHRPLSIEKLCNMIKPSCSARLYTIDVENIAHELGVSEDVVNLCHYYKKPCASHSREEVTKAFHMAQCKWKHMVSNGWAEKASSKEVAAWIAGNAFLQKSYNPRELVDELCALRLLSRIESGKGTLVDYTKLSSSSIANLLMDDDTVLQPAKHHRGSISVIRAMPLPAGCAPALCGKGGVAIKALKQKLEKNLERRGWLRPAVRLSLHYPFIILRLRADQSLEEIESGADAAEGALRRHLKQLESDQLHKACVRWEEGSQYHEERRASRAAWQALPSSARALALPSAGLDGFGKLIIRRGGNQTLKKLMQRRRHALRKKRQILVRSTAALMPVDSQCSGAFRGWYDIDESSQGKSNQFCQELLDSEHLRRICQADIVKLDPNASVALQKTARRLCRQLASVAKAEGEATPRFDNISGAQGRGSNRRRKEKKSKSARCQAWASDIAEGMKVHYDAQRFGFNAEKYLRM